MTGPSPSARDISPRHRRTSRVSHPLLEQRREFALEDSSLLVAALGCEDISGVAAVHPSQELACANQGTEQAVAIEVGAKIANPTTTEQIARFLLASRHLIEMRPDMVLVCTHVLVGIGLGKETV
jgi:hypothetical protein